MARFIGPNLSGRQRYGYYPTQFDRDMINKLKMAGYPIPGSPAPVITVDIPPRPMPGRKTSPSIDPAWQRLPHMTCKTPRKLLCRRNLRASSCGRTT